jgi:hypothetical protein
VIPNADFVLVSHQNERPLPVPASTTRPRVGSTSIREIAIFSAAPIITRTSRRPAAGYPAPQKKQVGKDGLRVNRQNRARPGVPRSPGLGAATVVLDQPTARPEQVANLAGQAKQKTPLLVMPIQFQRVDVDDPSISGLTKAAPAGSDRVGPPTADWLRGMGPPSAQHKQAGRLLSVSQLTNAANNRVKPVPGTEAARRGAEPELSIRSLGRITSLSETNPLHGPPQCQC